MLVNSGRLADTTLVVAMAIFYVALNFAEVWSRIESHAGEEFTQIRGGTFRYSIVGSILRPDRTNRGLPRAQFEEALSLVPLPNTTVVHHLQGPSYVYAILMDPRIRRGDW
jgi:hypothetical protein